MQTVGDAIRPIRTVALACGAAGEFLMDAVREGADVFLTGEMRFHDYLAAHQGGERVLMVAAMSRGATENRIYLAHSLAEETDHGHHETHDARQELARNLQRSQAQQLAVEHDCCIEL